MLFALSSTPTFVEVSGYCLYYRVGKDCNLTYSKLTRGHCDFYA
jgi:hypothetical protein